MVELHVANCEHTSIHFDILYLLSFYSLGLDFRIWVPRALSGFIYELQNCQEIWRAKRKLHESARRENGFDKRNTLKHQDNQNLWMG